MLKYTALSAFFLIAGCTAQTNLAREDLQITQKPVAEQLGYCNQPKPAPGTTAVYYVRDAAGNCVARVQ